jgi:hypothetical protein
MCHNTAEGSAVLLTVHLMTHVVIDITPRESEKQQQEEE